MQRYRPRRNHRGKNRNNSQPKSINSTLEQAQAEAIPSAEAQEPSRKESADADHPAVVVPHQAAPMDEDIVVVHSLPQTTSEDEVPAAETAGPANVAPPQPTATATDAENEHTRKPASINGRPPLAPKPSKITTASAPVGPVENPVAAESATTAAPVDPAQNPVAAESATTAAPVDPAQNPVAAKSATTPAHVAPVENPVATESATTAAPVDPAQNPVAAESATTPAHVAPVENPVATESATTPAPVDPVENPVATESATTPAHVAPVENPVATESATTAAHVDPVQDPVAAESATTRDHVDSVENPVTAESATTPAHVDSVENPVTAESATTPAHVDSIENPVTAESATTPDHVDSVENPVAASDAEAEKTKREKQMQDFKLLLESLRSEIDKLNTLKKRGFLQTSKTSQVFADAHGYAEDLYKNLENCQNKFINGNIDKPEFRKLCNDAINFKTGADGNGPTIKSILEKQPGFDFGQILRAILDFVLSLTVVLPIVARIATRNEEQPSWRPTSLFFFKPEPNLAKVIEEVSSYPMPR